MIAINNTTRQAVSLARTKKVVAAFLRIYKKFDYEVSIAIISAAAMKKLNSRYRGIDKTTDVLSFAPASGLSFGSAASPATSRKAFRRGEKYLGEVIINPAALKKTAAYKDIVSRSGQARSNPTPTTIFYFVLVHGLLHLLGRRDDTEKGRQEMLAEAKKFLAKI